VKKKVIKIIVAGAAAISALTVVPNTATASTGPAAGVPASYLGTLRLSANGRAIRHTWQIDPGRGGDCPARSGALTSNVKVTKQGWVDLHTTGRIGSCAEVRSPQTWTAGVFEAKVWFAGDSSGAADWPAWWMSGNPWPNMGEIDAAEAGWNSYTRCLSATWHYNANGPSGSYSPASSGSTCISRRAPAWYLIDIVREPNGVVQVWYNGNLKWQRATGLAPQPENMLVNITAAYPSRPADVILSYVRVWDFR